MLALIGPGSSHTVDLAVRRMGLEKIIAWSLQFWFVISTIFVTVLVGKMLISRSEPILRQKLTKLDWALFLSWWFVVVILSLFALIMGMAG